VKTNCVHIWKGKEGDVRLGCDLPYVKAVIQEGFRTETVAPLGVPRRTCEDVNLMGQFIPRDTQVKMLNLCLQEIEEQCWPVNVTKSGKCVLIFYASFIYLFFVWFVKESILSSKNILAIWYRRAGRKALLKSSEMIADFSASLFLRQARPISKFCPSEHSPFSNL